MATDGDYHMFLGIPYGQVNKYNPFAQSTPHPNFDGIFDAHSDSIICPQMHYDIAKGSLDCLNMNIFVPRSASPSNRLPVLVFFHGGFLVNGSNIREIFNPRFLLRHDVIFVAMNYRLGVYGFMCLHTPEVPGNQGIKDQVLGLRWVRDNIAAFGGDVHKITIGGESAGSRSVDLHLLSPHEKLFHKAIMQSGSAFNANWFPKPDTNAPVKLANIMGYKTNDVAQAIGFLSTMDPRRVVASTREVDSIFKPCVEKQFEKVEIVLKDHPLNLDVPKAKDTPIFIGTTSQEMIPSYVRKDQTFFDSLELFRDKLSYRFDFDDRKLKEIEKIVRHFYIGDEKPSENVWLQLADFDSDLAYIHDATRNIRKFLANGAQTVYYYIFDYKGERNFQRRHLNLSNYVGGAAHVDERGYLFDLEDITTEPNVKDQLMIDRITTLWADFVKYGDPTPNITTLLPVKWEPVNKNTMYFMNLTHNINLDTRPYQKRMAFLDLLHKNYGKYEKGFKKNASS